MNEQICYCAGEIDFEDINELIAEFAGPEGLGIGKCSINVWGNEGQTPHFHLAGTTKSKVKGNTGNFECCICLFEPLYFNHGNYNDKLDRKQRVKLTNWLKQANKALERLDIQGTNWQYVVSLWEAAGNPMTNVPKDLVQPDYSNMENMRD